MSRKPHRLYRQLVAAAVFALGASSVALADDSSMNPFTGDSYRYFNGGHNLQDRGPFDRPAFGAAAADPAWRQSHPNGLADKELQALSSSGLAASAERLDPPILARAAADPLWRQNHPNGLSERELEALSSSTLAVWQPANGPGNMAASGMANVAQTPAASTFSARMAKLFHPATAPRGTTY